MDRIFLQMYAMQIFNSQAYPFSCSTYENNLIFSWDTNIPKFIVSLNNNCTYTSQFEDGNINFPNSLTSYEAYAFPIKQFLASYGYFEIKNPNQSQPVFQKPKYCCYGIHRW